MQCIKCSMESSDVLFTLDQNLNIECYDVVDYTKSEYCDTAYSVCTTQLKLVKNTTITSSVYAKARFEKVYINYYLIYIIIIIIIIYLNFFAIKLKIIIQN